MKTRLKYLLISIVSFIGAIAISSYQLITDTPFDSVYYLQVVLLVIGWIFLIKMKPIKSIK